MSKVVVVDYGIGNIYSVCHALRHQGVEPTLSGSREAIMGADRIILPGVGAFGRGMSELRARGLDETLYAFKDTGRPLMGICLGMQMLLDRSHEDPTERGLGLIPGSVEKIAWHESEGVRYKIPHIAWCALEGTRSWSDTVLSTVEPGHSFYFVHSFSSVPDDPDHVLASAPYGPGSVTAAINNANVTGLQFHPERSGPAGMAVLKAFLEL